jgi:PAS domain S-box-containing protein
MRDRRMDRNSVRSLKEEQQKLAELTRNQALELLRQSESELAEAQQMANLGSWSWDINTGLMTWSDELYRIFGLHPREIQASFEEGISRVHPEDREQVLQTIERCLQWHERYNQPCRIIRSDGKVRLLQIVGSVVIDEQGTPTRMFGHCQDITELEATKEARRAAERKYRQIFENAGEGIFQSTPEGSYLTANPALARMHGFDSPGELIRSRRDISHEIYVDPARREEFKHLLEEHGVVRGFQHQSFRKDGSRIWISVNARTVRNESGKVMYYEGTTQDITEQKEAEQALRESEERYRELFENSKDALYVQDMNGCYTSVNRAAERLTGYTRDELIGEQFSTLISPEHAGQVRGQLSPEPADACETNYEVEITTKQGHRVPVEISSRLIFENGKPVGVQGCVRDISERKRAQEASRTYSRRLIEAQEAERRRISRELHDQVGQILTAVKMNLHALQKKCSKPEILSSIQDNMGVIDEAVDQVRDLSVVLRPPLLDDFGLVVALRWYLDRQAQNCGVKAEFITRSLTEDDRFSSELETACFRIVQEAITNVIRHAKATHISVMLERNGSDLILLIVDDGAGFDIKTLRSSATIAATLGLRGMEERAQAVGGSIKLDSAAELGTEICARFPIQEPTRARSQLESQLTGLAQESLHDRHVEETSLGSPK